MKILYLIPTLEIGGAEIDLVRVLPRLDRSRYEPVVWPFLERGSLACQLEGAGIRVLSPIDPSARRADEHVLRSDQFQRMRSYPAAAWHFGRFVTEIVRTIRAEKVDVLHAILPNSYLLGAVSRLGGRHRLVMSRLSQNWYQKQMPLFGLVERQVAHRLVHIAISNSNSVLDELRAEGVSAAKLRLVYNGINVHDFGAQQVVRSKAREMLGIANPALVLSVVANLHAYKGHADLFHGLALARNHLPDHWVLLVVGRDIAGNKAALGRLAEQLGIAKHIRILGERQDVPIILSAADIHVSASHTEGFPNNILEAMCAGLPVVATAVGGVPEQIDDGRTGLLVPSGDPQRLAFAIGKLAGDAEMRSRLGQAARDEVTRRFSVERTVAAFESIYRGLARDL